MANDISNSRAKALLKNLEVFGISNAFVTNEVPQNLAERFEGFFDKVLIDAPCSGEGMFRKDPAVIKTWEEERPEYFAKLQKDILKNGVRMLRPGGKLLYSTCTFAPVENEGSISWILEQCPEMELIPIEGYEGFSEGNPAWGDGREELRRCVRIWPHKMKGEGHFLALLKKSEGAGSGIVGELEEPETEMEFLKRIKKTFEVECLRHNKLTGREIQKVALCGGAGAFLLPQAIRSGADVFITGEIKYHDYFGHEGDILMAEIGHYESEQYTKEIFYSIIRDLFPNFALQLSKINTNPIKYL